MRFYYNSIVPSAEVGGTFCEEMKDIGQDILIYAVNREKLYMLDRKR